MTEFAEFSEILGEFNYNGDFYFDAIDLSGDPGQIAQNMWEAGANKIIEKYPDAIFLKDFNISYDENGYQFQNTKTGETFTYSELTSDLNNGNFKNIFDNLGANTSSSDFNNFLDKMNTAYNAESGVQARIEVDKTSKNGIEIETQTEGEPQGNTKEELEKDFQEKINKLGKENAAKFKEIQEKIIDSGKTGDKVNVGKWLKYSLLFGGGAFGLYELYTVIKNHQNAMNGCWLASNNDENQKCKIYPLTCNKDDLNTKNNTFQICGYCNDIKNCTFPKFNPCKIGSTAPNKDQLIPGTYNQSSLNPKTACSNCSYCAIQSSCVGENTDCSSDCTSLKYNVPIGYVIKCVSVNFWGAAEDFMQTTFSLINYIITLILKILLLIGVIIIILIIIYYLFKFILSKVKK